MEVITITSEAYKNLNSQLSAMKEAVDKLSKKQFYPLADRWLDNQEVCELLKISKRTLLTYRSTGVLAFSQYQAKIFYRARDISNFLEQNYNKSFQNC